MSVEKVYLELTNRCNLKCEMCYRKAWHQREMDMDDAVLEKCIGEIQSMLSVKEIVLGGIGEPTFAKKAKEVMEALKGYQLTLTTNGTLMDEAMVRTIVETVNHVIISIDGAEEKFYQIRQFSLERIIENIKILNKVKKELKSSMPILSFQMVLSDKNKDDVFKVIDLAESLQVSGVILSHILPSVLEDKDLILYTRYENESIKQFFNKIQTHAFRKAIDLKLPSYQLKTERRCRFIDNKALVITASGDVVPCYRFAHDGTEVVFGHLKSISAHAFGNIENETLKNIWDSSSYKGFRDVVFNNQYPSCTDCDLADGCDMIKHADVDCYSNVPSCGDCLWARKLIYCI